MAHLCPVLIVADFVLALQAFVTPEAYKCPLTHAVMIDPVVDPEGNSYERAAIENWLSRNETSPITRSYLSKRMLNPNRALRDAIEQFRQVSGDAGSAQEPIDAPPISVREPEPEIVEEPIDMSGKQISFPDGSLGVEICVEPPEGMGTSPMDIVAVVDVSGSMDAAALVDQGGEQVDVGFSVLE